MGGLGDAERVARVVDGHLRRGELAHGTDARVEQLACGVFDGLGIERVWHDRSVRWGADAAPAAPETRTTLRAEQAMHLRAGTAAADGAVPSGTRFTVLG